jgi:hypothetical protein
MYADKRNFNCNSIICVELVTLITNTNNNNWQAAKVNLKSHETSRNKKML